MRTDKYKVGLELTTEIEMRTNPMPKDNFFQSTTDALYFQNVAKYVRENKEEVLKKFEESLDKVLEDENARYSSDFRPSYCEPLTYITDPQEDIKEIRRRIEEEDWTVSHVKSFLEKLNKNTVEYAKRYGGFPSEILLSDVIR